MKKCIVLEIGHMTTLANAFGDLDTLAPKWLGQGKASTVQENVEQGIRRALEKLGEQLGSCREELEAESAFYFVSSMPLDFTDWITTNEALAEMERLIAQEVGDVLILDVGGASTDIFWSTKPSSESSSESFSSVSPSTQTVHYEDLGIDRQAESLLHLQQVDEADIIHRYGAKWREHIKPFPETALELALGMELTSYALEEALVRYCKHLSQANNESSEGLGEIPPLRWVVGTGGALTQLPGGMEVIQGALKNCERRGSLEGLPVLLDRENLMASLGAFAADYRQGAWQLLQESLGIEN